MEFYIFTVVTAALQIDQGAFVYQGRIVTITHARLLLFVFQCFSSSLSSLTDQYKKVQCNVPIYTGGCLFLSIAVCMGVPRTGVCTHSAHIITVL